MELYFRYTGQIYLYVRKTNVILRASIQQTTYFLFTSKGLNQMWECACKYSIGLTLLVKAVIVLMIDIPFQQSLVSELVFQEPAVQITAFGGELIGNPECGL